MKQTPPRPHLSHDGQMPFEIRPGDPAPIWRYPSGKTGEWREEHTPGDRFLLNAMFDKRVRRVDYPVLIGLMEDRGFSWAHVGRADIDAISNKLLQLGWKPSVVSPNAIALSFKRLHRLGYILGDISAIFGLGIDTKVAPRAIREMVFARDGKKCRRCGSTVSLCLDHIIARSKGGETVAENLQVLCTPCNVRKGAQ